MALDFLVPLYPWILSLHLISVIAWMAGMLYLPRLFVYHADVAAGSEASEMLKVMERRLLRIIINPAMIASFLFGGLLLLTPGLVPWQEGWIHAKLALVLALAGLHGVLAASRRAFAEDRNHRSAGFYRLLNEGPTLLMIAIVILVIVRPF